MNYYFAVQLLIEVITNNVPKKNGGHLSEKNQHESQRKAKKP
jgi:hypothetical protein